MYIKQLKFNLKLIKYLLKHVNMTNSWKLVLVDTHRIHNLNNDLDIYILKVRTLYKKLTCECL